MNHNDAMQCALGYAWGREDASGTITAAAKDASGSPSYQFAEAFAQGYDDFNDDKRCDMPGVRSAYERWQESGAESIFPADNTTEAQRARHEEMRNRSHP